MTPMTLLMQSIASPECKLDHPLREQKVHNWVVLLETALEMGEVRFSRSTWVLNSHTTTLIGFCVCSSIAYGSVIYL